MKVKMSENTNLLFSARLKELRKKTGMTQEGLATVIDSNRSNIANYENGKNFPSIDVLDKLASVFNCSTDYLLGRNNCIDVIEEKHDIDTISENIIKAKFIQTMDFMFEDVIIINAANEEQLINKIKENEVIKINNAGEIEYINSSYIMFFGLEEVNYE